MDFKIGVADFRRDRIIMIVFHGRKDIFGLAVLAGPSLGRGPYDPVRLSVVFECEIHITHVHVGGELRFEGIFFPAAAARVIIEGIGDGIEDGRLACAGRAADEEKRLVLELREVQRRFPFVGAECVHFQF